MKPGDIIIHRNVLTRWFNGAADYVFFGCVDDCGNNYVVSNMHGDGRNNTDARIGQVRNCRREWQAAADWVTLVERPVQ